MLRWHSYVGGAFRTDTHVAFYDTKKQRPRNAQSAANYAEQWFRHFVVGLCVRIACVCGAAVPLKWAHGAGGYRAVKGRRQNIRAGPDGKNV